MLLPIKVALILRLRRATSVAAAVVARICGHFKLNGESGNARNEEKVDPSLRFKEGQVNGEFGTKAV